MSDPRDLASAGDATGTHIPFAPHTPGPWHIDTNGSERWTVDFEGPTSSYITIGGPRKAPIAFAVEPSAYGGRVDANARLIAAAPDLLEALKVAHSELGNLPEELFDETKQRACALAYAAIAKAGA